MTRRTVDKAGFAVARHYTNLLWDAMDDAIALDRTGDTMVETPTPPAPPTPQPQPDPTTPAPSPTQPQ